jgi:hypothetical protein
MKFVKNLLIFVMLASGQIAQAQLFKLEAGIGATQIHGMKMRKPLI